MCFIMLFSGFTSADTAKVSVVASTCYVYEDASFDSPISINGEKIVLTHGDKLEVVEDDNGLDFIKVKLDGRENGGYVYRYYVTYNEIGQEVYPVFNGYVLKNNSKIYDLDKQETTFTANEGHEIYLYNGYNNKEEYNAVAIVLEDGSLFYGYMLTADIAPYGVNAGLITGIVVIASCLTIIFLLLFMKKTKRQ